MPTHVLKIQDPRKGYMILIGNGEIKKVRRQDTGLFQVVQDFLQHIIFLACATPESRAPCRKDQNSELKTKLIISPFFKREGSTLCVRQQAGVWGSSRREAGKPALPGILNLFNSTAERCP